MRLIILIALLLSAPIITSAKTETLTVNLQQIPLRNALYGLAKTLKCDALISEQITGTITLDSRRIPPETLLTILASKYGIKSERQGNLLIFTTAAEWTAQKQREEQEATLANNVAPLQLAMINLRYANATSLMNLLKNTKANGLLSKRGSIEVDLRTNTILIYDTKPSINLLKQAINKLDKPIQQILIETQLVSIDHDHETALGLSFTNKEHANTTQQFPLIINKWRLSQPLDATLSLLEKQGAADILSAPRLFTADQETASIETGEEVPYQESSENGGTTVAFKKAVLGLKITPHILPGGRISLNLHLNHDRPTNRLIKDVPMITTRQITTNVILKNRETIVLGGIYERDIEHSVSGIIGVNNIPIIGKLFSKNIEKQHKRELLIFVTPIIMNK